MTTTTPPSRRGRPRSFDRGEALARITRVFWERGFAAASIADLTEAAGIGAPSLYAAFGDKKALFREVVEAYARAEGGFAALALAEEPTARAGVARMLREAAAAYTDPSHPRGCLVITAATNVPADAADIAEVLRVRRDANVRELERRIRADVAAGVLPARTDPMALARFSAAVLQGMSQQSRDGATRAELLAIADSAMRAWPPPG